MLTTLASQGSTAPGGSRRARPGAAKTAAVVALAVVGAGVVLGALLMLAWMANEEHFDRPSAEFDALEAQILGLPGVESVETERWVEAPTFADPTSWMAVTVSDSGLPALLDAACTNDYPDPVTWSIRVTTPNDSEVSLHATSPSGGSTGREQCPDFGFDPVPLVDELDRVAPGLALQPTIWKRGVLTLVEAVESLPSGLEHLLPLVEHADELAAAADLDGGAVEINAATLDLVVGAGEAAPALRLLTELAHEQEVESLWVGTGATQTDGVAKVQVVAPPNRHDAIETAIRSSGLDFAGFPVRFLDQ